MLCSLLDRAELAMRQLGHELYPHQREALRVQGDLHDLLLCAATGGGKSAAFQAAAYASPDTLTVVCSPLVELIFEQTDRSNTDLDALHALGWPEGHAKCGSHERPAEGYGTVRRDAAVGGRQGVSPTGEGAAADAEDSAAQDAPALREGSLAWHIAHDPTLRLVYLTPEELASKEGGCWTSASAKLQWALVHCGRPIRAWVYDEIHLVEKWGSTFREAYLHICEARLSVEAQRRVRQRERSICVACTATFQRRQVGSKQSPRMAVRAR